MLNLILILSSAVVVAMGFAIIFNTPKNAMIGVIITALCGYLVRYILLQNGFSIELSTLLGATVMGFMAQYFSYKLLFPSAIFSISGSIAMVPGVFAYKSLMALINLATLKDVNHELIYEMIYFGSKSGIILGSIGIGIAIPNLIMRRYKFNI